MLLLDRYINVPLNEIDAHKMKYLSEFSLIIMKNAAFLEFFQKMLKKLAYVHIYQGSFKRKIQFL